MIKQSKAILYSIIISVLITGIGLIAYFFYDQITPEKIYKLYDSNISRENKQDFPFQYVIETPRLPNKITFCDEPIPIENFDVKERIEREYIANTYWHSSTLLIIKRANRWFPVIEPILQKYKIPDDIKFLAVVESNLENVISPANAVGFWQFLESTGKQFGLEIRKEVDERYDVEKSTEAAAKYLLKAKEKFGSWTLATASYNIGISQIAEQIERQKTKIYFNMNLPEETSRYLFRLLAIKEIMNNPAKYGFYLEEHDLYKPLQYRTEKVKRTIKNLGDWANKRGFNYRTLKIYNPWLRDNYLRVKKGKTYEIKIPIASSIEIISEEYYQQKK